MWCCYLPAVLHISVFESTFWRGAGVETSIQNQCMALEGYIWTHTQPSTLLISCTSLPRCIEENNRFLPICLSAQDLTLTKLNTFPTRTKVKLGKPFHCQSCHFSAVGTFQISSLFCAWPNLKKSLNPNTQNPQSVLCSRYLSWFFFLHTHKLPLVSITKLPEGAVQELSPCPALLSFTLREQPSSFIGWSAPTYWLTPLRF